MKGKTLNVPPCCVPSPVAGQGIMGWSKRIAAPGQLLKTPGGLVTAWTVTVGLTGSEWFLADTGT